VAVCAPENWQDALAAAVTAWAGYGPELVPVGECDGAADVEVSEGDPEGAEDGIAATTRAFEGLEILSASIVLDKMSSFGEVNEFGPDWVYDQESVLVHELGHAIGVEHVADPNASMYERIWPGRFYGRDLADADREAAERLYP
jgi:predicted Zn-dependent protease